MPNFENRYDIFNDTVDNFNSKKNTHISEDIVKLYVICDYCRECLRHMETIIPPCINDSEWNNTKWEQCTSDEKFIITKQRGCLWRIKPAKSLKDKNQYWIVQSYGCNSPHSIILRRAQFFWLLDNNVPLIIRGTRKNKLIIHHKNGIHHDDSKGNHALMVKHEKCHGTISSLKTSLQATKKIYKLTNNRKLIYQITKSINKAIKLIEELMVDSPLVWRMIEINKSFINDDITEEQCYNMLVELGMAEPIVS